MNNIIIYLGGGINGLSDADCKDWREYFKKHCRHKTLDPMRRDYRGKEDESVNEIVHGDEADLQEVTHGLFNALKPSWGTAMEIRASKKEYRKDVTLWVPANGPISPWLRYHSDRLMTDLDEIIAFYNAL